MNIMQFKTWICIITFFAVSYGCKLKYRHRVDEKPDIFVITETNNLGVCRIRHEENSSLDYLAEETFPDDDDPETQIYALHYDAYEDTIFYLTRTSYSLSRLFKIRLNDSQRELVFDQEEIRHLGWPVSSFVVTDIAYDWISKNVYINYHYFLGVINVENLWFINFIATQQKHISNIVLHPNRGYLYFSDDVSDKKLRLVRTIYRANLDGSNIIKFKNVKSDHIITNMVIDFYEDKLYWTIGGESKIHYSNLDGQDITIIDDVPIYYDLSSSTSRTLAIDRNYIYYRSSYSNSVRRLSKKDYVEDKDYELFNEDNELIKEIVVFTFASQKVRDNHPCKYDNGGCDQYCFAIPQNESLSKVCGCSSQQHIAQDGISCADGIKKKYT